MKPPPERVRKGLQSTQVKDRLVEIAALVKSGDVRFLTELSEMVKKEESPQVAVACVEALVELFPQEAAKLCMGRLWDSQSIVRVAAVEAIGKVGDETQKRGLKAFLKDETQRVRVAAAAVLAPCSFFDSEDHLKGLLAEGSTDSLSEAILLINKLADGKKYQPYLLQAHGKTDDKSVHDLARKIEAEMLKRDSTLSRLLPSNIGSPSWFYPSLTLVLSLLVSALLLYWPAREERNPYGQLSLRAEEAAVASVASFLIGDENESSSFWADCFAKTTAADELRHRLDNCLKFRELQKLEDGQLIYRVEELLTEKSYDKALAVLKANKRHGVTDGLAMSLLVATELASQDGEQSLVSLAQSAHLTELYKSQKMTKMTMSK